MPRPEGRRRGASRSPCRRSCFGSCSNSAGSDANLPAEAETDASRSPDRRGQFASEAEAKGRCGNSVVWVNTKGKSHTYHYSGSRWYGTTKQGGMCARPTPGPPAITPQRARRNSRSRCSRI